MFVFADLIFAFLLLFDLIVLYLWFLWFLVLLLI